MKNRKTLLVFYLMIVVLACFNFHPSFAQNNAQAAEKIYHKAIESLDEKKLEECISLLKQSILKDTQYIDPVLTLFQVNLELKRFKDAIPLFEKAYQMNADKAYPYFVKQASAYTSLGDYNKANDLLLKYIQLEKVNTLLKEKANALLTICSYAIAHPYNDKIIIQHLGDSINSAVPEYFPYFSMKDSILFFMRKLNMKREDFYTSNLTANGFSKATLLEDSINWADKKGSVSFSTDLQTLYFAADYPEQGYGRYDIYKSTKLGKIWSAPKNLGYQINTDFWDSAPSIAPDGNALYFSSNRPGGFGGIDIYVAYKNGNGVWEEAENLGEQINTAGDEQTPFMHADNKTLYFSSTGWPGYGGADFFVVRQKINGEWTPPLNLGFPINTFDNEGSIAVASNGIDAYFASDRSDSRGGLDIYKATLSNETRANKKFFMKGIIKDANSKKTISASIHLFDPSNLSSFMKMEVDSTGQFMLALPYLDSIGISITSSFHERADKTITNAFFVEDNTTTQEFYLSTLKDKFTQTFTHVLFATDSDKLLPGFEKELNELTAYLLTEKQAVIIVEGHTDNTGDMDKNKLLSLNRAKTIAQYLIANQVSPHRISTLGYGDTKPISNNETVQGRQLNRRTSFTITIPK